MARLLQVALMIAALLACPLNCSAHAAESGTTHKCGCQHCKCVTHIDHDDAQAPPEGGETVGGGCICRGAVLATQAPRLDLSACSVAVVAGPVLSLSLSGQDSVPSGCLADLPPPLTGRELRLSHLSLLL